tara:strand:+ start:24409 stop:25920 length:1512 start_codon:yes stop_codon:yes gene_type:complete
MTETTEVDNSEALAKPVTFYGALSRRLLVLILCCSTLFTLVATSLQLYLEYQDDLAKMNENVRFIESSYVPALARSLYELNDEQLSLQMAGALKLTDIVYLKVIEDFAGEARERNVGSTDYVNLESTEFPLSVTISGTPFNVGTLLVLYTTDNIARRVLSRAAQILSINAAKTFIVAFFMLWIIQRVVTRHIIDMAQWADGFSLEQLSKEPFKLRRKKNIRDELSQVTLALNEMRDRIASDITARSKLELESRKLAQDLHHAEKLQAIGELAGGIAHDFNNQLHIILGNADLLRDNYPDDAKVSEYIDKIIKSCDNSRDLISDLMTFSRKDEARNTSVAINQMFGEVASILRLGVGSVLEVKLDTRAERDIISGDTSQIQNAFLNIGLNARDAMPKGGKISLETENVWLVKNAFSTGPSEAGWFLKASIVDTGNGIDPRHISRIFEPFFTTKESGKGTGMGLATVYGTVRSHNAIIEVSSKLNEGTRFDLYFPVIQESPDENS